VDDGDDDDNEDVNDNNDDNEDVDDDHDHDHDDNDNDDDDDDEDEDDVNDEEAVIMIHILYTTLNTVASFNPQWKHVCCQTCLEHTTYIIITTGCEKNLKI
jgi:hypothetical protein